MSVLNTGTDVDPLHTGSPAMSRVDVVVVNWNAGDQLRACLETLAAIDHRASRLGDVVVVDNASTDGSVEGASGHGVPVQVVRNPVNRGFAAACNQGARLGRAPYVLFLNPDVRLEPDALERAIGTLEDPAHEKAAIAGIQLYDETGRTARNCARFPTPWTMVARAIGLDRAGLARSYVMEDWPHDSTRVVDHVIGAFYLVRRAVFTALGGFDESFFVYLEDVDFSRRAKTAGWYSVYLSTARAFHKGGGTSERVPAERMAYSLTSRLVYARKHFAAPGRLAVSIATLAVEPWMRLGQAALRGSAADAKSVVGAYRRIFARQMR